MNEWKREQEENPRPEKKRKNEKSVSQSVSQSSLSALLCPTTGHSTTPTHQHPRTPSLRPPEILKPYSGHSSYCAADTLQPTTAVTCVPVLLPLPLLLPTRLPPISRLFPAKPTEDILISSHLTPILLYNPHSYFYSCSCSCSCSCSYPF
ncbi:hypothetical protein BU24DRAFT_421909 [Aaosphaeria arxii CBS 175.79]|uniref:Uncharacterized protein n=1 Tax=Aaosphaeria arxii CBS 175.79 TaxID=1450172 RepID=A0A6A5XRQ0_9PLEO|nr:uncharacterized protein BU24DRAFT_421909 [Aaosphaeria arxii CBS 175.79]KAF2015613.1 hypothetical protein BU24DRAFT_421909 [Aaosphaeria arxii CBS 175.79]